MARSYTYTCSDYPDMQDCPGRVTAGTEAEVWKLMELHARIAHGEDPAGWTDDDRSFLRTLIKPS